jgi:DNA-binding response OmpR family regulator
MDAPASAVVLLIDPRVDLAVRLRPLLTPEHVDIHAVTTSSDAEAFIQSQPVSLFLLGAMLPDRSGVQYLKLLRSYPASRNVPIIILGRQETDVDIAMSLEAGADDYIPGPISVVELHRRIRAVRRRYDSVFAPAASTRDERRFGEMVLDNETRRVRVGGETLSLRPVEFQLLTHLLGAPGRVFTRQQLVSVLCDSDDVIERVIDVHVMRLRLSLAQAGAKPMIETVRGIGYRLVGEAAEPAPGKA